MPGIGDDHILRLHITLNHFINSQSFNVHQYDGMIIAEINRISSPENLFLSLLFCAYA